MVERKKSEAIIINGEFGLPEAILQRIQSFLTGKEAAHTAILSKSWYTAWLTRPNLDFDAQDFETKGNYSSRYSSIDDLFKYVMKTIQRYGDSNLKVESFRICTAGQGRSNILAYKDLIVKAVKMGATCLSLEIRDRFFGVPHEVFGSENLVHLSLNGCRFDHGMDLEVRCWRLESLSLSQMEMEDYDMISNIILSCPLIQKLSLSSVHEFRERATGYVDRPINLHKLHKLRCLVLSSVTINTMFFSDFSSRFPFLKDLILKYCKVEKNIQICSRSLEHLNFAEHCRMERDPKPKRLRVNFDVPNIRKFTFDGSTIPSVSFKPTSKEWESHISIRDKDVLCTSWFRELNKFLTQLNLSKISLTIDIFSNYSFDYEVGDIQCLLKPEIENLTMDVDYLPSLTCYSLYDGLFRLCRPKFITENWFPNRTYPSNGFLCKRLVQSMNRKSLSTPIDFMYGLNDLEEANVEIFEESMEEWRPLPLKSLLDGSTKSEDKKRIRFHFKWRQ